MKESGRLTDGQIVSYKHQWLACYKAAGNHLLFDFAVYMQIYNNAWQAADDAELVNAVKIKLNLNNIWYYGKHEVSDDEDFDVPAVQIE